MDLADEEIVYAKLSLTARSVSPIQALLPKLTNI